MNLDTFDFNVDVDTDNLHFLQNVCVNYVNLSDELKIDKLSTCLKAAKIDLEPTRSIEYFLKRGLLLYTLRELFERYKGRPWLALLCNYNMKQHQKGCVPIKIFFEKMVGIRKYNSYIRWYITLYKDYCKQYNGGYFRRYYQNYLQKAKNDESKPKDVHSIWKKYTKQKTKNTFCDEEHANNTDIINIESNASNNRKKKVRKKQTTQNIENNDLSVAALKKEIAALKHRNDELKQDNDRLLIEKERYRFTICSLKNVALNLSSANVQRIEWTKEFIFGHLTIRSIKLHEKKHIIQEQVKYAMLKEGEYVIENNPLNMDCQFKSKQLKKLKTFIERNHIGNTNPFIEYEKNKFKSMRDVLGIRVIENCTHLQLLEGENESYAKINIDVGVVLGQYCGNELLKCEYLDIYNATREEMQHLTYMMGEILLFPNYLNPSKKRKLNEDIENRSGQEMEIYIDGFGGDKSSPLLYINDGRINMKQDPTDQDNERMNVSFQSVLCNGWPYILVYTTKKIKKGSSLWIHYGPYYSLVMDEIQLIQDANNKQFKMVQQILSGVDLGQQNQFQMY